MNGEKQVALVDMPESEPVDKLALRVEGPMLPMIERLAALPDFDVLKLEKLLDMQERIMDRNAEAAFNAAFVLMQSEIPTIIERAKTDKGKYAPREDIVDAVRPILKRHQFTLSFRTEFPDKQINVVGILTHVAGHARESTFLCEADTSGSKNAIQARGSAVEYGRRYTTTDLLNITTRGGDNDGRTAGRPEPPAGFDAWWTDMVAVSDNGFAALEAAFKASKREFREYVVTHGKAEIDALKAKAKKVGA